MTVAIYMEMFIFFFKFQALNMIIYPKEVKFIWYFLYIEQYMYVSKICTLSLVIS